jgi:hypothetical protein
MIKNAGVGDAANFQKQISSDNSAPNIRRLQLEAPFTKLQNPEMRVIDSASSHLHCRYP